LQRLTSVTLEDQANNEDGGGGAGAKGQQSIVAKTG